MNKEELIDFANELKSDENNTAMQVFQEFAKNNNIEEEKLEELLSKEYDCFKCESCNKFYCYDEYSYFEEECIYCCNADSEEEF